MSTFKYQRLDYERPAFRLLRLLKGDGSHIQCGLIDAWFDDPTKIIPYKALSYTWGGTARTDYIQIGGSRLGITSNLYLALRCLRCEHEDLILWADAACIDQENVEERGHQVQQISQIYDKAEEVVIHLGSATYETNVIMESMKCLQQEAVRHAYRAWEVHDPRWRDMWSDLYSSLSSKYPNLKQLQVEGFRQLLGRPYFKRAWILQEVANARAARITCGTRSVSTRFFSVVALLLEVNLDAHCQAVVDIMPGMTRQSSWWAQQRDLRTLLSKFRDCEATDERDKVYALLGMSSDTSDTDALRADYSEENTVQAVIYEVASFLLSLEGLNVPRDFLSYPSLTAFLHHLSSLNRVVMDWALAHDEEKVMKRLILHKDTHLNAPNARGETLLCEAVTKNKESMAKIFLQQPDINIYLQDVVGGTPLAIATKNHSVGMVGLLLLKEEVDVNLRNEQDNNDTPLHVAVNHGGDATYNCIEQLLRRGDLNINAWSNKYATALLMAMSKHAFQLVDLILTMRQDVDMSVYNSNGRFKRSSLHQILKTSQIHLDLGSIVKELGYMKTLDMIDEWKDLINTIVTALDPPSKVTLKNQEQIEEAWSRLRNEKSLFVEMATAPEAK